MVANVINPPQVCASVDPDAEDPSLWRWVVTVPSCLGDPLFEKCGAARCRIEAHECAAAARAEFERRWNDATRQFLDGPPEAQLLGELDG